MLFAERGYFFRKASLRFCAQPVNPELSVSRVAANSLPIPPASVCWVSVIGDSCAAVQNFIGIGIADAADDARIGERPLERAVFRRERVAKRSRDRW